MSKKHFDQDRAYDSAVRFLLSLFAVIALSAAIWRMFAVDEKTLARLDSITLLYLGVAGALLLLRDVKSLAFGDYKVEFERVRQIAEEAQDKAENAKSLALGTGGGGKKVVAGETEEISKMIETGTIPNDPWKGQFGKEVSNNRKLEARVLRILGNSDLFSVELTVFSILPEQDPLQGVVQFYLHPTFKNDRPIIKVGANGIAELRVTAWGAFTVGAVADGGRTKLELDLAELEEAPAEFRNR